MKINADGIWLSDGTKLDQATQRTLRLAIGIRRKPTRKETADRIVKAVSQIHGKRWDGVDVALWIDNAIGEDEIDGAVLRFILIAFNKNMVTARAKLASDALKKYTEEQRLAIKKKANALRGKDRYISIRQMAKDLSTEDGIPFDTIRGWLKEYFKGPGQSAN